MFSWLQRLTHRSRRSQKQMPARPRQFEALEDRTVPATFTVTNLSDAGPGSLRSAVAAANASAGGDTVSFQQGLSGTISLTTGELPITDAVAIDGPGANLLSISGNHDSRVFSTPQGGSFTAVIDGMTLKDGRAPEAGRGGAILSGGNVDLVLREVALRDNTAASGGGVTVLGGKLTIERSTIVGNSATGAEGGGVDFIGSALKITDSHIANNNAVAVGGGVYIAGTNAAIAGSTIAGNVAAQGGGGVAVDSGVILVATNTTIDGNTAMGGLGGGGLLSLGALTINNSTVTANRDNTTSGGGGGLKIGQGAAVVLSSIFAENTVAALEGDAGPNIKGAIGSLGGNLIDNTAGMAGSQVVSSDILNQPAKLGPLQDNGGLTPTRLPLAGSPALGTGSNPLNLTTDQRGGIAARARGSSVDIGAVTLTNRPPSATLAAAPAVNDDSDQTSYEFVVTYDDDRGITMASLGNTDVVVTGPNGYRQTAELISVDNVTDGAPRQTRYRITPPGGTWRAAANGTYSVAIQQYEVLDIDGASVAPGAIGTFSVNSSRTDPNQSPATDGFLRALYLDILGREPDAEGYQAYIDRLNRGVAREQIAKEIWESVEHREQQVRAYYLGFLGREPDADGWKGWVEAFRGGASEAEVMAAFLSSAEYRSLQHTDAHHADQFTGHYVEGLYHDALGRAPDEAGMTGWSDLLANNRATQQQAALGFTQSQEAKDAIVNAFFGQYLKVEANDESRTLGVARLAGRAAQGNLAALVFGSEAYFKLHGTKV